jgi:uncharacterized protein (DUF169 family)
MENLQELARTYRRILQLKAGPVAIRIIKTNEEIPVLLKKPDTPIPSFCFGIMEAFKGKSILLGRSDVQCLLGLTALGFRKESSKPGKHKKGVQSGLFGNEEASPNYLSKGICLPAGQTRGVAMSPLEKAIMGVDIVLFKVNSEQAMWLLAANQYPSGERNDFSIGTGFQGVCSDVIVYPLLYKKVNMTVNGVGDRTSAATGKNELFVGIPYSMIKKIASNLTEIYQKPVLKVIHSPKGLQKLPAWRNGPRH